MAPGTTLPLLLLTLASFTSCSTFLEEGMEYWYDMHLYQNSGTMDYQPAAAGLAYRARVRMQVSGSTVHVGWRDLRMSQYVGEWDNQDWAWDKTTFVDPEFQPEDFSIHYKNGLVESLSVPSSSSTHMRNLMRAFASSWQLQLQPQAYFAADEKLVHGSCRVQYTVSPGVVRKSVAHMKDCSSRVHRLVDNFRGYRCDGQWSMEAWGTGEARREGRTSPEPIYSDSNSMFFVEEKGDRFQVNKLVTSGAVVAQYFETAGVSHFIHVNRSLTLVEAKSSDGSMGLPSPSTSLTDLAYQWEVTSTWDDSRDLKAREAYFSSGEYFSEDQPTLQAALAATLENIVATFDMHGHDSATIDKLHKHGAGAAMPILYALDFDSLVSVFNQLKADASEAGAMKQNLFREFVTETGTTASAMWIKDAVTRSLFASDRDTARSVTGVAFHVRRPNVKLLEEYEELVETYSDGWSEMVGPLAVAHLARRTCELAGSPASPEHARCIREVIVPRADKFFADLTSSTDDTKKHILMAAMQNLAGARVTELLKPMASGEVAGVDDNLQKKAIYASAIGTYYTQSTIAFFLPIFLNMRNGHESRIAAINMVLMKDDVDVTTLGAIMTQMYIEMDYEVKNYVFTAFEKHANGQDECFSERKTERIRYFLKYMEQAGLHDTSYGVGVSKTYRQSYYQEQYGYSGGFDYWVVGSHRSSAPLELGMQIDANLYNGYRDNLLTAVLRIEGLAKGIVNKFHKLGKEWKVEDLQGVFRDMGVRVKQDVPIRVELTVMLKNIVVAQSIFTAADAEEGGKLRELLKEMQGKSANSYSINHQRAISFGSSLYEQPSDSGLPMAHVSAVTSLISVEATVKRGLRRGVIFRDLDYNLHLMTQGSNMILFQQPISRRTYGIVQDRVHTTHAPRQIVIGVNLVKKELKIQLSEPEVASPLLMLMHSKTVVTAREDSLTGDLDISPNCPMCASNKFVVSKGEAAKKSRTLIDTTTVNFGSSLKTEYFDCEMELSEGQSVGNTIAAFTPYNKSPKTPWSLLMLGVRQIRAFFLYFPRAEQCGIYTSYSQSAEHPVREIEVSIQGKRVANKKASRLGQTGQSTFVKVKVAAKGPAGAGEDREFKVNIKYDSGVMARKNSLKIQLATLPNPKVGIEAYLVCFSMENEYSNANTFEREMMQLDLDSVLEVWGKADIKYGTGTTCGTTHGSTDIQFRHSTTQLAREQLRTKEYYKTCMEQKASPEWSTRVGGGAPYTLDCWRTEVDAALARKYTWSMNFEKTTPLVKSWLDNAHTIAKAAVLPYWNVDTSALVGAISDTPKLDFEFIFKNQDRSIDATIVTEKGTTRVPGMALPIPNWPTLRQLRMDESFAKLIMERVVSACVQTSRSVTTLDWASLPSNSSSCWSLLSGHCAPTPSYAVFTKKNSNMPLAMKVYLGGHVVEFTPTSATEVKVTHNGQTKVVRDQESVVGRAGKTQLFTLVKWGPVYSLYSDWNVLILYDGTFVEVVPAPWVKGQHCGLCGNFDGNSKNEVMDKAGAAVPEAMLSRAWCR